MPWLFAWHFQDRLSVHASLLLQAWQRQEGIVECVCLLRLVLQAVLITSAANKLDARHS